jgi:hypothetical protein
MKNGRVKPRNDAGERQRLERVRRKTTATAIYVT